MLAVTVFAHQAWDQMSCVLKNKKERRETHKRLLGCLQDHFKHQTSFSRLPIFIFNTAEKGQRAAASYDGSPQIV